MGRSVMLSNGRMLVGLNEHGLVHDFYYPYVGEDNLTTSRIIHHNIGVFTNGNFSWLGNPDWSIDINFGDNALISDIRAENQRLGVELRFNDFVDERYTALCRSVSVRNLRNQPKEVKLFMHQAFQISRGGRGDTAMYVPGENYLLDYKGWCSLLIYAQDNDGQPFDQYAVGNYGIEGKEGTFKDAEDGELSGNSVEHGGVDSVLRIRLDLEADADKQISYWVIAADSQFEAESIHHVLKKEGLHERMHKTGDYWSKWLSTGDSMLQKIDAKYLPLAKKSLMIIKSHCDSHGGIIASCDSSIYNYGRDYYSYVWPRDGALTILPLIKLGYTSEPRKFLEFSIDTMHPRGYMRHKYQPDKAIGSTWHPLLHKHSPELAIQEDETASVVYAMAEYFKHNDDPELKRSFYSHLIKPAAEFMYRYFDEPTGLPHASYDLWEERFATHTYSVVSTIAALKAAASFAAELHEKELAEKWNNKVAEIYDGLSLLFNQEGGYFRKSLYLNRDGELEYDETLDCSSAFGFLIFNEADSFSDYLSRTVEAIEKRLLHNAPVGGLPRYEHDNYFLTRGEYLGNPWMITTLWLAQFYILTDRRDEALKLIDWVIGLASPSGMLSEQIDPVSGDAVGVSPLVWSHATLVDTLLRYYVS